MSDRAIPSRRDLLAAGAAALLGLPALASAPKGKAKSVLFLFLHGGAPTQDMFDLKPDAPAEVRGEFKPIATSAPGIRISEHLPKMAKWMHKAAILRSLGHKAGCHNTLPAYTGYVAHRAIFPSRLLGGLQIDDLAKWWSDDAHRDTHLVVYYLDRNREEFYFVSGVPEPEWDYGLSFVQADLDEMRASFEGFHPTVQKILAACPEATKWPLFDRIPLPLWSRGRVVLLGDACHPMKPHMAQGAAMAIEDGAILARVLDQYGEDVETAFRVYEVARKDRTSRVQKESRENRWLREPMDPSWVFGYDALEVPLPVLP